MKPKHDRIVAELVRGWLAKAGVDLRAAERLLKGGLEDDYFAVAFHAQQAAEKQLKALLTLWQIPFGKTHNIGEILDQLSGKDRNIRKALAQSVHLTPYAVEFRYPSEKNVDKAKARRALSLARKVGVYVRSKMIKVPGIFPVKS